MLPLTPARRVALALGVPVCLALTGFTGLNIAAQIGHSSFHVSYRFPVRAGKLAVNVGGGNVSVRQAAVDQATLTGIVNYSLVRPYIGQQAGTLDVNCDLPVGNCGLDATLSVPEAVPVSVSTGGGDLTAASLAGEVTLSTNGGNVTVDQMTGTLNVRTGGGDVTVGQLAGDLEVSTDGGNVQATDVAAPQVSAHSGGGDIKIVFTRVPRNVDVSTSGGNITIVLPPGRTAYHVIASTAGGSLSYPIPLNTSSKNVITATSGGGNISITESP